MTYFRPTTMIRLAFLNLGVNKLRSALTVLGIVFGTGAVIATLASNEGASDFIRQEVKKLGTNIIYVKLNQRGQTLKKSDREMVQTYIPDVRAASLAFSLGEVTLRNGAHAVGAAFQGVEHGYFDLNGLEFARGRRFGQSEETQKDLVAVIGAKVAGELFGDTVPIGEDILLYRSSNPLVVRVVGTLKEKGGTAGDALDRAIFIPASLAGKFGQEGEIPASLLVRVKDDDKSAAVKVGIGSLLSSRYLDGVSVSDAREALEATQKIWRSQNLVGIALAVISLLTGGVGIMNIMLMSIAQRKREIGIRKSVGAKTWQVFVQILLETLILCFLGGLAGLALGVGFGNHIAGLMGQWEAKISPFIVMMALTSACATGLIFGILPALRAARLDPYEALRGS